MENRECGADKEGRELLGPWPAGTPALVFVVLVVEVKASEDGGDGYGEEVVDDAETDCLDRGEGRHAIVGRAMAVRGISKETRKGMRSYKRLFGGTWQAAWEPR